MLKNYADIVFAGHAQSSTDGNAVKGGESGAMALVVYFLKSLVIATVLAVLTALDLRSDDLTLARTLIIVAIALTVIQYLLSMITRHSVLRVIPSMHLKGGLGCVRTTTGLFKVLITLCLALAYLMLLKQTLVLNSIADASDKTGLTLEHVFELIFVFRMFARGFHDPYGASIESIALLQYDRAGYLCLFAFLLHRARVLFN